MYFIGIVPVVKQILIFVIFNSKNFALAAWSSGNVSACHRGIGAMGRDIESRQGIGWYIV
jgi:hypothetical protein